MSEKRKLEEYQDPDYPQNVNSKRKCLVSLSSEDRLERVRTIIKREFRRELLAKEQEIMDIDNKILLAKRLLHKVRYAVISSYYNKKGLELFDKEVQKNVEKTMNQDSSKGKQTAIHPALKSILGKRPIDYNEILKIRPTREAAKTAKSSISEKLRTKKEEKSLQRAQKGIIESLGNYENIEKIPRHISPIKVDKQIKQLNVPRGKSQTNHLIVVGNTSKYIGDEKSLDGVTHKWLVYVQTKTNISINKILNKVRFFLHPSYRPNDIVDVCEPPFQLSRRGWGEFPIRLQLFFQPKLQQKPVQLVHNLILDKTMSGLQTMGAETLVEMWLCSDHLEPDTVLETKEITNIEQINGNIDLNVENLKEGNNLDNLETFLNKIETHSPVLCTESDKIEPTITDTTIIDSVLHPLEKTIKKIDKPLKFLEQSEFNQHREYLNNIKTNNIENTISSTVPPLIFTSPIKTQNELNKESLEKSKEIVPIRVEPVQSNNTIISTKNETKVLHKKLVKCITKDGNVRLIQMLITPNHKNNTGKKFVLMKKNGLSITTPAKSTLTTSLNVIPSTSNLIVKNNNNIITNSTSFMNQTNSAKKLIIINKNQTCNLQNVQSQSIINDETNNNRINDVTKTNQTNNIFIVNKSNLQINSIQSNCIKANTQSQINNISHENNIQIKSNTENKKPLQSFQKNSIKNKNNILFKNGKMYIIDPIQAKLKQQIKKQESLLKPQISLLKPIIKNDILNNSLRNETNNKFKNTVISTDHDYTSLIQTKVQQKPIINTIQNTSTSRINIITTIKSENELKIFNNKKILSVPPKPIALMQKERINYRKQLENKFLSINIYSIRQAVEFLLKQLPLINNLAINTDFKSSFPFIISNEKSFNDLITPKQKSNEWLRAKFILELLQKHKNIDKMKLWTTKEIILFARQHAYTPVIKYIKKTEAESNDMKKNEKNLKDLVKKEIKREKFDHITVSSVDNAYKWINKVRPIIEDKLKLDDEIIVVDCEEDNKLEKLDSQNKSNRIKVLLETPTKNWNNKYWIPIDDKYEKESILVNDVCLDIGVRLKPEEILPNVMYPSAQVILVQAVRSFVEDLLRRSISIKSETEITSSVVETLVQPDDIKSAILSRTEFDFLTNKDLGVKMKIKEQID